MATGFVTIKVTGAREVGFALQHLQRLPKDLRKEFKEIDKILRTEWKNNFQRQEGDKKRWVGLTPITQDDRSRQGYNPSSPILRRTNRLALASMGRSVESI